MIIQICVGSSCYLKGSEELVGMLKKAIEKSGWENEITLAGSFCIGKCNKVGVTIQVDDEICVGVTPADFPEFWENHVAARLR